MAYSPGESSFEFVIDNTDLGNFLDDILSDGDSSGDDNANDNGEGNLLFANLPEGHVPLQHPDDWDVDVDESDPPVDAHEFEVEWERANECASYTLKTNAPELLEKRYTAAKPLPSCFSLPFSRWHFGIRRQRQPTPIRT